jgi:opacity protein-like surface antigen
MQLFGTRALVRTLLVAAIPLVAGSAAARAQSASASEPLIRIGFGGGVSVPVSDAANALNDGVNGAGFIQLNLLGTDLPALRFAFTYDRYDYKPAIAGTSTNLNTINPGTNQIFGATGGVKIHLVPGQVRPYVTLGVGAFNVRDAINASNGTQSTISSINFGLDAGGGFEARIGRLSAFAEVRVQNVFTQSSGLIKTSAIQTVPVTFGILF